MSDDAASHDIDADIGNPDPVAEWAQECLLHLEELLAKYAAFAEFLRLHSEP